MKRLLCLLFCCTLISSCKNSFEDYFYYGTYFSELSNMGEITLMCAFLNTQEENDGMVAIRQVNKTDKEILEDSGAVGVYQKDGKGIKLNSPMRLEMIDGYGELQYITIDEIEVRKNQLLAKGQKTTDKSNKDYDSPSNFVYIDFQQGEMADYVEFIKNHGE